VVEKAVGGKDGAATNRRPQKSKREPSRGVTKKYARQAETPKFGRKTRELLQIQP
jgi:hypothetical protein